MRGPEPSGLAGQAAAYTAFKHSTGVGFKAGEYHLRGFVVYCEQTGHGSVTREAVEGYVAEREDANPGGDRSWTSYLRGFGRWVRDHGEPEAYVLEEGSNPRRPRPARYLLTQEQVDAFFQAAAVFDYPEPWQWQARAFFGLMAACGLRTCEARRLERADVDLAGRAVDVKWSKGPRSRRLFVNDQVAAMLEACDRRNGLFHPGRAWFFTTGWRNQVPPVAPGVLFNRLWSAAGLARPADGPAPGPYTFRHHFAYANIERWAARGEDVAAMMPYLMRYMGHSSIASTLYYTHVSPDFTARHAASHAASAALLPRVGFDV